MKTMPPISKPPPAAKDETPDDRIRRLAMSRILDLEEELKKHGMRARCGMEVEFFVDKEPGKPVHIPTERLEHIAAELGKSRYVEDLREENIHRSSKQSLALAGLGTLVGTTFAITEGEPAHFAIGLTVGAIGALLHRTGLSESLLSGRATKAAQYEINLGDTLAGTEKTDRHGATRTQRHRLGPLKAAIATDHIKEKLARLMLEDGTVNYTARPRHDTLTSAMHINMSLGDQQGRNLFAGANGGESPLMRHCIASLVEVQKEGPLLFLPSQNSHDRIGKGRHTPSRIGRETNKFTISHILPSGTAASRSAGYSAIVNNIFNGTPQSPESNRIENRMPGADADPYLAVLANLAAMLKAVKEQEAGVTPRTGHHPLPRTLEDSLRLFRKSEMMKEILGTELHDALAERYRQQAVGAGRNL